MTLSELIDISETIRITRARSPRMESLTFVDETGLAETTFIPETYEPSCDILDGIRMFLGYGKVGEHFGTLTMTVEKVETIKG